MTSKHESNGVSGTTKPIGRRDFLRTSSVLALAAASLPMLPRLGAASTDEIVVASWGGSYTDAQIAAFFSPFEEDTGNKVIIAEWDLSKLQLMVESENVEWDLITGIQGEQASVAQTNNLLMPIDYNIVPKDGLVRGTAGDYYVAAEWYSAVIAWSTDAFPNGGPQNWADFWDTEKFPGPRALGHEAVVTLLAALLADGVAPDSLFPIDYDRAFKSLDRIKSSIDVWYTSNGQPPQLLTDGQVVMSTAYNARIQTEMNKGAPMAYTWSQNIANTGGYAIPHGASNPTKAMELIAYSLDPERQARFAELIPYGVTTNEAFSYLDAATRATLPTAPENIDLAIPIDPVWVGEHFNEMSEKLDKYILS